MHMNIQYSFNYYNSGETQRSLFQDSKGNEFSICTNQEISIRLGCGLETSPSNNTTASGGIAGSGLDTCFGVIAGGQSNMICAGTAHTGILGGINNCIAGSCSAILGGSGNFDNGLNYAGIFGFNINNPAAMAANTFHVNCLNACDTPGPGGTYPSGSIYWNYIGNILPTDKVLLIAP